MLALHGPLSVCEASLISLPTRAQRPVEPANTVHILPVFRLLLLPHPVNIIPLHFRVLR